MTIDVKKFEKLVQNGFINKQIKTFPRGELIIWNYSEKTQYENFWTEETLLARGLITDIKGNIVAQSFPKFFNLEEHIEKIGPLPDEEFDVYEKYDGSLGILFFDGEKFRISTRGSFCSEQAIEATKILEEKSFSDFNPEYTYLFEIIYPENRIVVDYKGERKLVLLGVIETKTGKTISVKIPGFESSKKYNFNSLSELRKNEVDNTEGFVVHYPKSNMRVKVKFSEYIRLHRLMTQITSKDIWESLCENIPLEHLYRDTPDEFYQWVKDTVSQIKQNFSEIESTTQEIFNNLETSKPRKQLAKEIFQNHKKYSGILFRMLDKKSYDEIIWKMVKPETQKPFTQET